MSSTSQGRQLTEAHRLAQAQISAAVVRRMLAARGLLTIGELDTRFGQWLTVVAPIITDGYSASAGLTANYLTRFRTAEGITAGPAIARPGPLALEHVQKSMTTNLVAAARKATTRMPVEAALNHGITESARDASRLSLKGGRRTLEIAIDSDDAIAGWARATSSSPCAYCASIAGYGARFDTKADAEREYHASCHCFAEPVFRPDDYNLPPGGDEHTETLRAAQEEADSLDEGDIRKVFAQLHANKLAAKAATEPLEIPERF